MEEQKETALDVVKQHYEEVILAQKKSYEGKLAEKDKEIETLEKKHVEQIRQLFLGRDETLLQDKKEQTEEEQILNKLKNKYKLGD